MFIQPLPQIVFLTWGVSGYFIIAKALEEFCANKDYTYEVLAISFYTKQVAVRIVGI